MNNPFTNQGRWAAQAAHGDPQPTASPKSPDALPLKRLYYGSEMELPRRYRKALIAIRPPTRTVDPDGTEIVQVPLPRGEVAVIEAADYEWLLGLGLPPNWSYDKGANSCNYVRVTAYLGGRNRRPRGLKSGALQMSVARLIMRTDIGEIIRYRDSNRLNLRRSNLNVCPGRADGRELTVIALLEERRDYQRRMAEIAEEAKNLPPVTKEQVEAAMAEVATSSAARAYPSPHFNLCNDAEGATDDPPPLKPWRNPTLGQ